MAERPPPSEAAAVAAAAAAAAVGVVAGAGPDEWVWSAIAAGDSNAVSAAPSSFDIDGVHPKYGSVLTAYLQGLLNLEGRFVSEPDRGRRAKELVAELGRRGARPDLLIPGANFRIKGMYRDWRLTGDVTPMQALIQMRNDLINLKFESAGDIVPPIPGGPGGCKGAGGAFDDDLGCVAELAADLAAASAGGNAGEEDEEGADADAKILSGLIDKYSELIAGGRSLPRSLIPEAIVSVWEQCLQDTESGDVEIVSPDGSCRAHSLLLSRASPVVGAMLACGMREGAQRAISVEEASSVVRLFLALLYTGCLPTAPGEDEGRGAGARAEAAAASDATAPGLQEGARVAVVAAFMSNSSRSTLLPVGLEGLVCSLDRAGDALIRFDGLSARQWVTRRNFRRLRPAEEAGAEASALASNLAGALSLARRWQAEGLAELLDERLARCLSPAALPIALEAAELHGTARLRSACLAFARNSSQVRAAFDAGEYGPAVLEALEPVFGPSCLPRKRKREVL